MVQIPEGGILANAFVEIEGVPFIVDVIGLLWPMQTQRGSIVLPSDNEGRIII